MIEIELSKGFKAIIDDEDLEKVSICSWHFDRYAKSNIWLPKERKNKAVYMHRIIMDAPKGMDVDHINGNKLDNRKANLRVCTRSDNLHNSPNKSPKSKLQGAYRELNRGDGCKWFSTISVRGKTKRLGRYTTAEKAHEAYAIAHYTYFPHITMKCICHKYNFLLESKKK